MRSPRDLNNNTKQKAGSPKDIQIKPAQPIYAGK
jgi:hypothetical protein